MSYELRDHTADIAVEAEAATVGGVFAAVADGLAAASIDPDDLPREGDRIDVSFTAEDLEGLLYDYLGELIYIRDTRDILPVDNNATVGKHVDGWEVRASARGVPTPGLGAREVKAVTYSDMVLDDRGDSWYGYVVFDV